MRAPDSPSRPDAAAPAQAAPAQAAPDALDFQRDVLDASRERPVLVDFWAEWCGPCRTLGPVLDRLAGEAAGRWRLVKVNTDLHPELMTAFGIRGIPAVKLFAEGAVVAEFTGALPEYQVRRWLEEHLPSPAKARLAEAAERLEAGDRAAAVALLEAALEDEPASEDARALLARALALTEPARAVALVEGLAHRPEYEAVHTFARLGRLASGDEALPETPVTADYRAAARALALDDFGAALDGFIAVMQRDRGCDDDGARKAALAVFQLLGEGHPAVQQHRPVFNRSLY